MQLKPLLLHLSNTLLKHSHIPPEHQVAWAIATQHLTAVDCCFQLSTALALTVTVGQCTQLNAILQQQLLNLISDHSIIDVLLEALDYTLTATQHETTAALVRAIHSLALLNCPSGPPVHNADPLNALSGVFQNPQHRQRLLQAACSSCAGAEAVAALVVTAASVGLPAATLLQDLQLLVPGQRKQPLTTAAVGAGNSSSNSSGGGTTASRKAWVAAGLRPLLLRVQRQLQLHQQSADGSAHDESKGGTSTQHQQQHRRTLRDASGLQQLWLLPCMALQVADGQLLDSATLDTVGGFLADPAVRQVLHMALLVPNKPGAVLGAPTATLTLHLFGGDAGAADAVAQENSNSTSARRCSHPSHRADFRVPTLQLLRQVAAHSTSLAQRCFDSLAPVLPDVLQACRPCPYCLAAAAAAAAVQIQKRPSGHGELPDGDTREALAATRAASAEARAAVLQLWQQLLLKGCSSYPSRLHGLLQSWLPAAAKELAAVATAATGTARDLTSPVACQQGERVWQQLTCLAHSRAEAMAAAFVPLAWQQQAASKPLVCLGGSAGMVQMLTPHVPALVQLVQAGAGTASKGAEGSAAAAAAAGPPGACSHPGQAWVLLLAMWLLQSWAAALQQRSILAPVHAACASIGTSISSAAATQLHQVPFEGESAEGQESAASMLAAVIPQIVSAVAELVGPVGNSGAGNDSVQVRCQAKGLDMVCALLVMQPASGRLALHSPSSSSSSNSNSTGSTITHNTRGHAPDSAAAAGSGMASGDSSSSNKPAKEAAAGCWEQLLSALADLVSRHPRDPMSLAHRQLLQTACLLLGDLAGMALAPMTATAVVTAHTLGTASKAEAGAANMAQSAIGSGKQQQQQKEQQRQQVWQDLYSDLQVLHEDLVSRKLVRSNSRKELLQAVGDVVGLLGKLKLDA